MDRSAQVPRSWLGEKYPPNGASCGWLSGWIRNDYCLRRPIVGAGWPGTQEPHSMAFAASGRAYGDFRRGYRGNPLSWSDPRVASPVIRTSPRGCFYVGSLFNRPFPQAHRRRNRQGPLVFGFRNPASRVLAILRTSPDRWWLRNDRNTWLDFGSRYDADFVFVAPYWYSFRNSLRQNGPQQTDKTPRRNGALVRWRCHGGHRIDCCDALLVVY